MFFINLIHFWSSVLGSPLRWEAHVWEAVSPHSLDGILFSQKFSKENGFYFKHTKNCCISFTSYFCRCIAPKNFFGGGSGTDWRESFKARIPVAAYKELISEQPSFELSGASKKNCRPISCVKIHSESIADIFFDIRPLQVVEIWPWRWIGNLSKNETTLIEPFSWHMSQQTIPICKIIF